MGVKQRAKSLKSRNSKFSNSKFQLNVLNGKDIVDSNTRTFSDRIKQHGFESLSPVTPEIFQINIGKLCNQTCAHCHVDAGPDRKEENMSREILELCLKVIEENNFRIVDITGGAPEMNPHFKWFVASCTDLGAKVMNRCNLTIIRANKKYYDLPEFFAKNKVEIISSLPYFTKSRTDGQRGDGVFDDSIDALKMLNEVGYGITGSDLTLNLVYNPSGAFLSGNQQELEAEFKRQLKRRFDISFNSLFAINNLPISRFLDYLIESKNYHSYMEELVNAFNPDTIEGLMCRNTVSVSWDGYLYDCDFNQMLDLKSDIANPSLADFNLQSWMDRKILLNQHCYGCTAGAGSSCGGEIS